MIDLNFILTYWYIFAYLLGAVATPIAAYILFIGNDKQTLDKTDTVILLASVIIWPIVIIQMVVALFEVSENFNFQIKNPFYKEETRK